MKKLFSVLLFIISCHQIMAEEKLVTLEEYHAFTFAKREISQDRLYSCLGLYYALFAEGSSTKAVVKKFQSLPVYEQCWIVYFLTYAPRCRNVQNSFMPSYNSLHFRLYGTRVTSEDILPCAGPLQNKFLDTLRNESEQRNLYQYAQKYYSSYRKLSMAEKESRLMDFAFLIKTTAAGILMGNTNDKLKKDMVDFLINIINDTQCNDLKTTLSIFLFPHLSSDQLKSLKTTEYALIWIFQLSLASGTLKKYFPVIYPILHKNLQNQFAISIINETKLWIPGIQKLNPAAIINWLKLNNDGLFFNSEKKQYQIPR